MRTRIPIGVRCGRGRETGQATVEFALILFPLLTLVAGIIYFGIGLTAAIDRFTSFFLQVEGLPFADQLSYKPRLAFMDAYNGALIAKNDHFVYGMTGITLKF